ncbi:MAG TPA: universal stress protein [Gemmatimonadales bacterium]|nr:universal stress protein [Gemmatimonadales bacterium]
MFKKILIPLEHTKADATILAYAKELAGSCGASLVLIHVADGWVARNLKQLDLRESQEMRDDLAYLEKECAALRDAGFDADAVLAAGEPGKEIALAAKREGCDLIAMATHGHKGLADVVRGSVANEVRHLSMIPVLMVRVERRRTPRD